MQKKSECHLNALQYENYVAFQLSMQGFKGIHTTAKTGDFGADILCFDLMSHSCAVQCKLYSKPVGYKAVQEAFSGARNYNCQRAIVVCNTSFPKNAIIGAQRLGVDFSVCRYNPNGGCFEQV